MNDDKKTVLKAWESQFERYGFFPDDAQDERNLQLLRIGLFIVIPLLVLGATAEIFFFGLILWKILL